MLRYTIAAQAATLEAPRLSDVRIARMIRNLEPSAARGIASSIGSIHGLAGQVENYSGTTVSVKVGNGSVIHGGTVSDSTVSGIDVWCGTGVVSAKGADVTCKRCLA